MQSIPIVVQQVKTSYCLMEICEFHPMHEFYLTT